MSYCGKPFCSCCDRSYAAGLGDGFNAGFQVGYSRGHRAGYVSGYLDAAAGREPLAMYANDIKPLLPDTFKPLLPARPDPVSVLPTTTPSYLDRSLPCGCWGTCTCPKLLSCGCYGTCTCPKQLSCGCYGTCMCWSKPDPPPSSAPARAVTSMNSAISSSLQKAREATGER